MNVDGLYSLSQWYKVNVLDTGLTAKVTTLIQQVNSLLKQPNYTQFKKLSVPVGACIQNVDYRSLRFDELEAIEKLDLKSVVLEPAFKLFNDMIEESDLQVASARLIDMERKLQLADNTMKDLLRILPLLFEIKLNTDDNEVSDKVLTRVHFHNDALISNVVNLSDWTSKWNTIARGYSMALGQAPETFEVVGASKGSIIFDLLLDFETVKLFSETFNLLTESAFNVAELYAAIKGIKILKESNPELYKQNVEYLEAELAKKNDEIVEQVADRLLEKIEQGGIKRDGEVKVNLKKAIKEVDKFVGKGGNIDFRTESDDIDKTEQVQLVNDALKQLQHRAKQKQLEDKTQDTK